MPDQKPPRLDASEQATLHALLQYQRDSLVRKITGADEGAARWSPVGSGTTLIWLVKHLTHAEILWIVSRFGGEDIPLPDDRVYPEDTVTAVVADYRRAWVRVDAVVSAASLDERCRRTSDETPVNLRWVLMHLLEETARHAGQADILRELLDGTTGR